MSNLSKDDKVKIAEWIYKEGKRWIEGAALRNLDRTAYIFINLLKELDSPLADKLYQYYNK